MAAICLRFSLSSGCCVALLNQWKNEWKREWLVSWELYITCLILRMNGELSVLDMDDGHEQALTNSVELLWVTCSQMEEKGNLIKEVSWLDYGHQGMQVWYPSHGANPFKQEDFLQLDLELEFDREVYHLGLLPNVGVVVGVSQRMSFSTAEFPCFEPSPQAQIILHCLLRHLLQREK